jgi:hypothetical protein
LDRECDRRPFHAVALPQAGFGDFLPVHAAPARLALELALIAADAIRPRLVVELRANGGR